MSRLFVADLQKLAVVWCWAVGPYSVLSICCVFVVCVVSIVVYCLLLDVVAGVVFGCRRIVDSVAGNVQ